MTPADLAELLKNTAAVVLVEHDLDLAALPETVAIERPRNPEHGDYATNLALQLAKKVGVKPRDLAEWLAERLIDADGIAEATVAGPGFVNLRIEASAQSVVVLNVLGSGDRFGTSEELKGRHINLEFVSANPTGPIHIGGTRWAAVGDALGRLTWWEIGVIVLLIAVRQTVNAGTLPILIPGLSLPHALQTALSGTLIQTFTPPPADTVLRLSMLKSFGVETTRGAAALVLDTIVFYLARFVAPVFGLLLTLLVLPLEGIQIWMAIGGLAAGSLLVWAMVMISKGERAAGNVGRVAARAVRRLRPTVDPDAWAAAVVRFQKESSSGLVSRMARLTLISVR